MRFTTGRGTMRRGVGLCARGFLRPDCIGDMTVARWGWVFGIAAVALAPSQASADLRAPSPADGVARSQAMPPCDAACEVTLGDQLPGPHGFSTLVTEVVIDPPSANAPLGPASKADVISLPPAPGSAALFLSAMVSLGAWQLVRSSRDLHLGAMPDWYHTGAPAQIGHATVFDFEFSSAAPCLFDDPAPSPVFSHRVAHESRLRLSAQPVLSEADPRGPPGQTS